MTVSGLTPGEGINQVKKKKKAIYIGKPSGRHFKIVCLKLNNIVL